MSRRSIHVHTHLTIFVNGKARVIPYGIGIPGFQAVEHARGSVRPDGELLLLAARARQRRDHPHRVAQHDAELHARASSSTSGASRSARRRSGPPQGKVTVFFTSPGKKPKLYTGDPRNLPAGRPLPDPARRRHADRGAGPAHQLGRAVARWRSTRSSSASGRAARRSRGRWPRRASRSSASRRSSSAGNAPIGGASLPR